jgi:hypothetical protein
MVPSTVATGAPSGDKFVRIVTLTTPSLPLSSIDMYNNDVGQESAQKFMK